MNNFKIKALSTSEGWITKEQIYEFKNGRTIWDDGGWHLNFEKYKNKEETIIIYTKGKETHAIKKENGKVIKSVKAICHTEDEFDFEIGAKIAFDRLIGNNKTEKKQVHKEEQYLKLVNWDLKNYGKVGKPTKYKDNCDKQLFVGDKVLTISDRTGDYSEAFVVSINDNEDFIMGIHANCNQDLGTIDNWKIVKIQDFSKTQKCDKIEGIECIMS